MTIPSGAVKIFTERLNHSAANIHIFQFVAPGQFLHYTRNFNSLGPIYSFTVTNQTTSGLERQIGPFSGPYLDIGPDRDQVPKSGLQCKHCICEADGHLGPVARRASQILPIGFLIQQPVGFTA